MHNIENFFNEDNFDNEESKNCKRKLKKQIIK